MSGHSKWSTIKHQKGANDQAKGRIFTKLAAQITIAVRDGGGVSDPQSNFKLRLAVEKARDANMPKENIERAIKRAVINTGETGLEEILYEGFAPLGVAVLIEAVTDNHQRSTALLKNFFIAHGGHLGSTGCVRHIFTQVGIVTCDKTLSYDELFNISVTAQVQDIEEGSAKFYVQSLPQDLHKLKLILEKNGLVITSAELIYKPQTSIRLSDQTSSSKIIKFLQSLEELDDVHKVFSNVGIPNEFIK